MKVSRSDMLLAGGTAALWLGMFIAAIWVAGHTGEKLAQTACVLMFVWFVAGAGEGIRRDFAERGSK